VLQAITPRPQLLPLLFPNKNCGSLGIRERKLPPQAGLDNPEATSRWARPFKPVIQQWVAGFFIVYNLELDMVEHVTIADADRHEVKHASTGVTKQALLSNGDGTTQFAFVSYPDLLNKPTFVGYRQVLTGFSIAASQAPSALDTALQVEFGGGVATTDATLGGTGTLTFNVAGDYAVNMIFRFGRTSGAGTAVLLSRFLINDVQGLNSNALKLPDQDAIVPFSTTLLIQATAGMTLKFQMLRDSSGINNGGMYRVLPVAAGWNLAPTATIIVSKFVGAA
jgi:hypothetical protein